jgi:PAS domain S-box-containing protein
MASSPPQLPTAAHRPDTWRLLAAFGLGLGAIALNALYQPALLAAETPVFRFGGALVFLAFLFCGQAGGLLAAALQGFAIAVPILRIDGDVWMAMVGLLHLLEAWIAWRLTPVTRNLVISVMAFWYGAGWLLDIALFVPSGHLSLPILTVKFVQQVFNGIINALLAQGLYAALPRAWQLISTEPPQLLRRFTFDRLLLIALPPAVLLVLLYTRATLRDSLGRAKLQQQAVVSDIALEVRHFLTTHQAALGVLASRVNGSILLGRLDSVPTQLREYRTARPLVNLAAYADSTGQIREIAPDTLADGRPVQKRSVSDRPYFQELRAAQLPVVTPLISGTLRILGRSNPVVLLGHPLTDPSGAFLGAVVASLDVEAMRPLIVKSQLGPDATVLLVDRSRRVISSTDPRLPTGLEFGPLMANTTDVGESGEEFTYYPPASSADSTSSRRYAVFRPIDGANWGVVLDFGATGLYTQLAPALAPVIAVIGLAPLLLFGLVRLVSWQVSNPLQLVRRATESISRGEVAAEDALAPLAASPVREIRNLADEFVVMGGALARQAAESRHREAESEERFSRTFENPVVGILHLSPEGKVLRVNTRLMELLGFTREELLQMSLSHLIPERVLVDADAAWRRVVSGELPGATLATPAIRKDGRTLQLQWAITSVRDDEGSVKYVIVGVEDLTERRALEQQLLQAQKMEAVGLLAGGVAHDFNNLLTPIIGYSEMALEQVGQDTPLGSDLLQIQAAAERARDLTQQLLAFGRKQVLEMRPVNLGEVLDQFRRLLRPLVRENIVLTTHVDADLGMVRADVTQVQQVLMNLCVNAVDAMPDGGRLTLEARNFTLADSETAFALEVEPGPYVALLVLDTGHGMGAEVRRHLFEPFFTTKERGKGTGLGLATVYGIVRQHGGAIRVGSAPGEGTAFTVLLPRVESRAAPRPSPAGVPQGRAPTRDQWILVVEDEPAVRRLLNTILTRRGYRVMEATSGEEALAKIEHLDGPLPLLCTDIIMPGISGRVLFERLRGKYPELKALFVSGYTGEALGVAGRDLEPGTAFIQKPFAPEDLVRRLDQLIEESNKPPATETPPA